MDSPFERLMRLLDGHHPSTRDVAQYFSYGHLTDNRAVTVAQAVCDMACVAVEVGATGPEMAVGLRKLLEAKDCLVRATLAV